MNNCENNYETEINVETNDTETNGGFTSYELDALLKKQKKKKRGAIARLIFMAIAAVIGIVASYAAIGYTGFAKAFINSSMGFIVAAIIWPIWKWVGFILPKCWGWAKAFWQSFEALNLFTLYIKFCIFVIILFLPMSIATGGMSALCSLIVYAMMNIQDTFFNALWVTAIFVVLAVLFAWIDVCTIKGERFVDSVKSLFNKKKA
ncbi:MAG: hypothetical protein IKK70_04770 [Clostridia bacterium]|nr:hypothetical protein [Clostridia bacterium]